MSQPILRVSDPEVLKQFRAYVIRKYGHLRGVMSKEATNALKAYMEFHRDEGSARTHIKAGNRTMKNLKRITNRILEVTEKEIPQPLVEKIITEVAGGDTRTLRRYVRSLGSFGVLRPSHRILTFREPKFIFEVNLDEAKKLVGLCR